MIYKISAGVGAVLILLLIGKLYLTDSAAVRQALLVQEFLQGYCRLQGRYPDLEVLETQFPELYPDGEWYYWPNEARTAATFQYPMTLPLPSAPGRSKVSEFVPVIYSFAVRHPCSDIL